MARYNYDWLIEQYIKMFGTYANSQVQEAIIEFVESGISREIYYELARMIYYRRPIWYVKLSAYFLVKKAVKNTPLKPMLCIIVKKITTDAKAKALSG